MLTEKELQQLNEFSVSNMAQLEAEQQCGCFYCLQIFSSCEIESFIEDDEGDTAVCPFCEMDSVIGESSGYKITPQLLSELHNFWF